MPFTIKDIENLTGIKAHTIRIWEQRYDFLKPHRTETNIRFYSNDELKTLLNIALLNKNGFKISHISKMSGETIHQKVISLKNAEAKKENIVNGLIQNMVDINMYEFEGSLDKYISSYGIEKTILEIIFPFLEKIGILWLTDNINPAQEHLVSNIIRQKMLVGIEVLKIKPRTDTQICLFLPEGEYHELALLFVAFLLKKQRVPAIYLGASIPMSDVEFVVELKKPHYLYTHLTTAGQNFNFEKFISTVSKKFPEVKLIVSGKPVNAYMKKIPLNVSLKRSLTEVIDFVSVL